MCTEAWRIRLRSSRRAAPGISGEAYYWRAWNRRALTRLAEAAADIETAKRVLFNAAVPKLAGFIAFERDQLPVARAELAESLHRNPADCEVHFALGQVHMRTREWGEAGGRFVETTACARAAQAALRTRLDEIAAAPLDPPRRQRLRARVERDIETEHNREGLASVSAAAALVLAGRVAEARPLAEAALAWPRWRARARELLERLGP